MVLPGGGKPVKGLSGDPTVALAGGEETAGTVAVYEQVTAAGSGPPLHIHHECAEMFYVLEGELTLRIGSDVVRAPAGTFAFVPQGVTHTYTNLGTVPARLLYWFSPAARMTSYFTQLGKLPPGPPNRDAVDAIAREHGVSILWEGLDTST